MNTTPTAALALQIIQTVRTPMLVIDESLRIHAANTAFQSEFNVSGESLAGRDCSAVLGMAWGEAFITHLRTNFGDATTVEVAADHRNADGPMTLLVQTQPLTDVTPPLVLLSVADVTERRLAESTLASERRELQRSNTALGEFAHAASHDLQEPLRKIIAFSERVLTSHGALLPEQGREDLARIRSAAARMRTLTDGLLETARAASGVPTLVRVDLRTVVADVLQDLDMRIADLGAAVTVGPLPAIQADAFQMRQLVQNLVGNSLKFHRPGARPEITITADVRTTEVVLAFRDNGIGFEPKYRERIFGMFMRLHSRSDYEGSGLGLSLCRTIVERHRGTLTAVSEPGVGSTFHVTLPRTQSSPATRLIP